VAASPTSLALSAVVGILALIALVVIIDRDRGPAVTPGGVETAPAL